MKKIILIITLAFTIALSGDEVLDKKQVVMIEKGFLKEAILAKDYDTLSTMAISFLGTSLSPSYKGDSKELYDRGIELLEVCHNGGHISSSFFMVKSFLNTIPSYSRKIASELIKNNKNNINVRNDVKYVSVVMLYVSSVLDHKSTDKNEVNFALGALQSLPSENAQTKFYSAFLFKSLGSEDIADVFLNDACHSSKVGSAIYNYCVNGEHVEIEDLLEDRIINKDCKEDLGQRCK